MRNSTKCTIQEVGQVSQGGANKTVLIVFDFIRWRKRVCSMVSTCFHSLDTNKED
jgi:hypothetical protein